MPLYTYSCEKCDITTNLFRSVDQRHAETHCECGSQMKKIIATGFAHSDVDIVTDDIDGINRRITSSHELKSLMRKNDVTERFGKGWI